MSKVKKLLAMLMAVVMTLGMSVTAFAANQKGTITVSGLASTGTNNVTYYKILEPDVEAESGYKIVDDVTINGFATAKAFLDAEVDEQKAALANEQNLGTGIPGIINNNTFTAEVEAGYYAVFITNIADAGDPTIVYNSPMIVSVEYDKATPVTDGYEYNAITGENSTVVAKYTTIPVTKEGSDKDDGDDVVEIGGTATYTIETYIPSEVTAFTVTDKLTNATYLENSVVVRIDGFNYDLADVAGVVNIDNAKNWMTIDLSGYLVHAGKKVTITYDVTVTGTKVGNVVRPDDGKHKYTTATDELYTGAIKLTKLNEENQPLNDAKFVVYKIENATTYYAIVGTDGRLQGWTENKDEATRLTTKNQGTIQVEGLDLGEYYFEEVEAPLDYSINANDAKVTITKENTTAEAVLDPAETSMTDTRLASLPSTGGIGTTIFTIGGCLIMIVAAGLFFATRRKAEK